MLRAIDDVAAKTGHPIRVTRIIAEDGRGLTLDVQDPSNHRNVDEYVIAPDGTMASPIPVQLSAGSGPVTAAVVDRIVFDPKKIPFARLAGMERKLIASTHEPDVHVIDWQFQNVGNGDYIYLEGPRSRPSASITRTLDFKLIGY